MSSKAEIRAIIKEKMKNLEYSSKVSMDEEIRKNIYNLREYYDSRSIFSYVSQEREVDTIYLINRSITCGKIVCVTLIVKKNSALELRIIKDFKTDLEIGNFNILEPKKHTKKIDHRNIDIFFIPGVAFGTKCERLGRGGGYFDRFLLGINSLKIGLAYEFQIFDSLPTEKHDITMDMIITEKRVITCV